MTTDALADAYCFPEKMRTAQLIMAAMFLIAGTLSAYAAIFNPEWFFRSPNVRILTGNLRRPLQRLIYALLAAPMLLLAARLILSPIK